MNYKQIHDNIIENSKTRILEGYKEKHHIIPKCLGGKNIKENIAILTAKEHYIIHQLLVRIYPTNTKLIYAFWMMCNGSNKYRSNTNAVMYEEARKMFSSAQTGKVSSKRGITLSQEIKNKISKTRKAQNNTHWIGRHHTKESKLKQSNSAKHRQIIPENENKRREGISKGLKGVKKSSTHALNIAESKKGCKNPMFGKHSAISIPVYLYEDNMLIRKFNSHTEAAKVLNVSTYIIAKYIINKKIDLRLE